MSNFSLHVRLTSINLYLKDFSNVSLLQKNFNFLNFNHFTHSRWFVIDQLRTINYHLVAESSMQIFFMPLKWSLVPHSQPALVLLILQFIINSVKMMKKKLKKCLCEKWAEFGCEWVRQQVINSPFDVVNRRVWIFSCLYLIACELRTRMRLTHSHSNSFTIHIVQMFQVT